MAKREKRITAMRRNPKNVRPQEMDVALQAAGFAVSGQRGSHKRYARGPHQLTVPQREPFLLEVYVKQALALLDAIAEEEEESHE